MFIVGENPVTIFPQPSRVKKALSSLEFLAVTDMFLSETAELATVVLPAASFAEKEGTFTNFEGRVQRLKKAIGPVGDSLPDGEIVLQLAKMLGSPMPYGSYQQIMEEIEEMVPFYRHSSYTGPDLSGLDLDDVDSGSPGTRRLYKGLFPSGFGRFSPVEYSPPADVATDGYPYTLLIGSSRYHFGSGSRSSHSVRLRRYCPEITLEISREDAKALGINDGDSIRVISPHGELQTKATLNGTLLKGMLFMPVVFPSGPIYELFNTIIFPQAKAPALKSCAVRLERTTDDD